MHSLCIFHCLFSIIAHCILHCYTVSNNTFSINYRLWKLRPIMDLLSLRFREVYTPSQKVCVDESLFRYRGRHHAVQYIPSKRARYGLKAYKVCETDGPATGYTSAMRMYMGDDQKGDTPVSHRIVRKLLRRARLMDQFYEVYTDNWYSSPALFHELQARGCAAIGTVRTNRKHMPKDLDVKKKGDKVIRSSPTGMLALSWRDKKQVII